jgi:hypothetical protein
MEHRSILTGTFNGFHSSVLLPSSILFIASDVTPFSVQNPYPANLEIPNQVYEGN